MNKIVTLLLIFAASVFSFQTFAASPSANAKHAHTQEAKDTVTLHFFWSQDCPHCVAAHPFIDKLKAEYSWLKVQEHEVSGNPRNGRLFEKMARERGKETSFVPTFFVGKKMIVGYTNAQTTGEEIRSAILENHKG
jgi:thiol-disulfide isomerase/thioredoxin